MLCLKYNSIDPFIVCGHLHEQSNMRKVQRSSDSNCLQLVAPKEVTEDVLLDVHTPEYLQQLKKSKTKIAQVLRLCHITLIPV